MTVSIRLSTEADQERIRQLAELDSKRAPHGDVLVAEVNRRLVAPMGIDGSVDADPFERTASIVELLRSQVAGEPRRMPRRRRWLSRLVAAG